MSDGTREVRGWCAFCRSRCGSISVLDGDRLVAVRPDPDHPTGGALCPKGRAAPEIVHSDKRILHPLRRTRPKGDTDPGWQRIGWDEALDQVAAAMDAARRDVGPEAVAFACTTPSGTPISDSIEWIERFVRGFGSPNTVYASELCNWHKDHAHIFTFGCGIPPADYRNAELILLWGHNPSNVWLAQAGAVAAGRAAGARVIVIDPRRSRHAADADLWLQVRPGTDAALALGLARILLDGERFDADFVRRWTNAPLLVDEASGLFLRAQEPGCFLAWDEVLDTPVPYDPTRAVTAAEAARFRLRGACTVAGQPCRPAFDRYAEACAPYTPAHVEVLTGVPAAHLEEAAAMLAGARRIAYHAWTGIGQHANATQTERAVATLYALTGAFDRPGGNVRRTRPPVRALGTERALTPEQASRALGLDRFPLGPPADGWILAEDFYRAVLTERPYPVRVLVGFGSNLLVSHPQGALGRRALGQLGFHVHCDLFHTPTTAMADIVLPVNTPWERPALKVGFEISDEAEQHVQFRPAMIPPVGEARSDAWIVAQLARRLGFGEELFGGNLERGWNEALASAGITLDEVKRAPGGLRVPTPQPRARHAAPKGDGVAGFATPTGRVELYSERLHRHGYSPVPVHVAAGPTDARFPFRLSGAKHGAFCHSQHRGIPSLRRRMPEPVAEIAPALAEARGIADGDRVRLGTAGGAVTMRARVEPSLRPDQVVAPYGWWEECAELGLPGFAPGGPDDASYNSLVDGLSRDPVSGAPEMRSVPCDVVRVVDERGWPGWRAFRVAAVEPEAADTVTVRLRAVDGGLLPDYLPGQHLPIRVRLPDGTVAARHYSLSAAASVPARTEYRISVRSMGRVSRHIVHGLRDGDTVEAQRPGGLFALPVAPRFPVVMVAGGIGVTPFVAFLETLHRTGAATEALLLYGVRDRRGHAFADRLAELEAALPGLRVVTRYSREAGQAPERVSAALVPQDLIDRRARFYLCGPDAMMAEVAAGLIGRGVFPFDIFSERFQAAAVGDAADPGPHRIELRRSGRTLEWTAAMGTVLDAAERAGVALPAGCRTGQCESCAVPVLAGSVAHLSEVVVEDGHCLTCQAVPRSALVLDA